MMYILPRGSWLALLYETNQDLRATVITSRQITRIYKKEDSAKDGKTIPKPESLSRVHHRQYLLKSNKPLSYPLNSPDSSEIQITTSLFMGHFRTYFLPE